MRWLVAAGLVSAAILVGAAPEAEANGRAPGTSSIHFRRGHDADIVAGMTFGVILTHDHGVTWHWMCEDAVGYGGTYDPDYVYSASGSVFATTFDGLRVMRDGCTFGLVDEAVNFFSEVSEDSSGKLFFAAAQTASGTNPGNSSIYSSTDDGVTLSPPVSPGMPGDWWSSLEVAPSNPQRIYATGYRFAQGAKVIFSFRSTDGGATYQPMPTTGLTLMPNSKLEIAGISATNPDLVYAHVVLEDNAITDALYRSMDGGQSWTRILGKPGSLAVLVRSNGDLIAGIPSERLQRSTDQGVTWTPLAGAPHSTCVVESAAHEVWACSQELTSQTAPGDGFTIMKSTDNLASWSGVLKFADIQAPVACDAGTIQHDTCDRNPNHFLGWCGLCAQLGCTPAADYGCPGAAVDAPPGVDAPIIVGTDSGTGGGTGCCDTGASGSAGALVLGAGVALVLATRRKQR